MSMYSSVTLFAFALQLCTFSVVGEKVSIFDSAKASIFGPTLKTLVPDFENICGEPEVWRRLTKDPSVEGVSNIPWAKIDKMMQEHLKDKDDEIVILEKEIQILDERIAEKMGAKKAVNMPVEDMTKLIEDGVAPFASEKEKGIDSAKRTKCGKPFANPRAPQGANKASPGKFKEEAETYFHGKLKTGKPARCTADTFLTECLRLLPEGESAYDSYCPSLCQKFTNIAVKFSEETAGEDAGNVGDLAEEREKRVDALAACKADVSSCKTAQDFISGLGHQITKQKEQIDVRFGDYQEAEIALADAEYTLDDVIQALEKESLALAKADEALKQSAEDTDVAEADVAALKEEEEDLRSKLEELKLALTNAEGKLNACEQADSVVTHLKNSVAAVALNMKVLFTKVALEPLDRLGLGTETDMGEYIEHDIKTFGSATGLNETLLGLKRLCEGPASKAFKKVESVLDLTKMCTFGDPAEVHQELISTVNETKMNIKKKITDLQTWFDPYKGQKGMDAKKVAEFIALGEPEHLRATVGVYSRTEFFRKYLKEWTLKGTFLKLIAQLKDVAAEADKSFEALSDKKATLEQEFSDLMSRKKAAVQALDAASKTLTSNEAAKSELEKIVEGLTADQGKAQDDYSQLLAEFEKAVKMWDQSKEQLVKAHQEATSFLQSMTDETSLLDTLVAQSERELARMRVALTEAEKAFEKAEEL